MNTISSLADIACTQTGLGRFAKVEKAQVKILERRRNLLGRFHPDTIDDIEELADTWHKQGKVFESERLLTEAGRLYERSLGITASRHDQGPEKLKTWRRKLYYWPAVGVSFICMIYVLLESVDMSF